MCTYLFSGKLKGRNVFKFVNGSFLEVHKCLVYLASWDRLIQTTVVMAPFAALAVL